MSFSSSWTPNARDSIGAGSVSLQDGKLKAAIAINNNAVSLLGRGYFREALVTFKDSVQLMRSASLNVEGQAHHPAAEAISAEDLRSVLDRTWKRAAQCKDTACHAALEDGPDLQVVSSQHIPHTISPALTSYTHGCASYVAFPMTIDPIDFEDFDDNDVDFHSGAILYNYGIAHECLAEGSVHNGDDSLKKLLQGKTYCIFQMANALLSELSRKVGEATATSFPTKLLLLRILLTHALIQASAQLDLPLEYEEHSTNLQRLLYMMAFQESAIPMADHCVAAAA